MREAPEVHEIAWPPELGPYDPHSHEIQANPFPHYVFMREKAPVLKVVTAQGGDQFYVSRFDDVQKTLRDAKRFSSAVVDPDKLRVIVLMDPPRHSHLRSLVSPAFTPKAVAAFQGQLQSLFEENFVPILKKGKGDICKEFTERMALGAIVSFLGLPMGDFEHLRDLSNRLHSYIGRVARHAPGGEGDEEGFLAVLDLLRDALEDARKNPKETIVAKFGEQIDAGLLTEEDFLHFCAFLFQAGQETTSILMANGFLTLAEQPALIPRLRENPQEIDRFIEELARLRAAPQKLARITTEEVEIAGFRLPAKAQVKLLPGSANRDSAKFPNGEVFDIDRDPAGHVGFGTGMHTCLGMWLARLETKIVFQSVVKMVSKVQLSRDMPIVPYLDGALLLTGPRSVHLELTPADPVA